MLFGCVGVGLPVRAVAAAAVGILVAVVPTGVPVVAVPIRVVVVAERESAGRAMGPVVAAADARATTMAEAALITVGHAGVVGGPTMDAAPESGTSVVAVPSRLCRRGDEKYAGQDTGQDYGTKCVSNQRLSGHGITSGRGF